MRAGSLDSLMACVNLLNGTDVMTSAEYSLWWDQHKHDDGGLFDALRRHLAKSFSHELPW